MSIFDPEFMRLAFASGTIVGLLAPAVGFFLVQRRLSLIGDGIGHVAFAGVAGSFLLGISPLTGALLASVGGAAGVEWLRGRRKAAGDQALALLFYTGIAAGVVLVSAAGELNANLFAYLFGSILTVTRSDVVVVVCLGLTGLVVVGLLYRSLVAAALDEDAARLNVFLAALAGVTIAVSMRIVGILLIAALMVLPVTAASRVAWSIRSTMLLSMAIGVASVLAGLTISYYANLAPGGAIVLVAAGAFVLASLGEALA